MILNVHKVRIESLFTFNFENPRLRRVLVIGIFGLGKLVTMIEYTLNVNDKS